MRDARPLANALAQFLDEADPTARFRLDLIGCDVSSALSPPRFVDPNYDTVACRGPLRVDGGARAALLPIVDRAWEAPSPFLGLLVIAPVMSPIGHVAGTLISVLFHCMRSGQPYDPLRHAQDLGLGDVQAVSLGHDLKGTMWRTEAPVR